jgi:quercetin dioxygenase-like cupin family protein
MQYHIGKYDESRFAVAEAYREHARGFECVSLINRASGSVHCEARIARLAPGGSVPTHVHAYEKGIYVFDGELELMRDGVVVRLPAESYALIPYGTPHAFRNRGGQAARWFEILSPQPKPQAAFKDLFFTGDDIWPEEVSDAATDAAPQHTGVFKKVNPLPRMSAELQQGLTVYRFMECNFGAQCFYMMRGEMVPGAYRTRHDHPIEEFYMGLAGEVIMDIEGESFRLGRGDVAWTGVGTSHAFRHVGTQPFQWIETQTPQFPAQFGTRNYVAWEKLRAGR